MKHELFLRNFDTGDDNKWICYKNYVSDKKEFVEFATDNQPTKAVEKLLLVL